MLLPADLNKNNANRLAIMEGKIFTVPIPRQATTSFIKNDEKRNSFSQQ